MDSSIIQTARRVLQIEAEAINSLLERLDENFEKVVETIFASNGRVVVTGMGKSGIICKKIAATLAIAPTYGEAYRVSGEFAAHNYRFDEAVVLTRRALVLDPGNSRALADLGIHLLRAGDEPGARVIEHVKEKREPRYPHRFDHRAVKRPYS